MAGLAPFRDNNPHLSPGKLRGPESTNPCSTRHALHGSDTALFLLDLVPR